MKRGLAGCIGLAAIAGISSAQAADLPSRGPAPFGAPMEASHNWTGWYFGVLTGLNVGQSKHTASFGNLTPTFDLTGGVFGLASGYNWQIGQIVLGYESDFSLSTKKGSSGYIGAPAGFLAETSERWLSTYRGRIGMTHNTWLFYVTGGAALANIKIIATEPLIGIASQSKTQVGWTGGIGVEAARLYSFSVKAEYLFADFGHPAFFNPPPAGFINRAGGVRLYDHILRIGLNHPFLF